MIFCPIKSNFKPLSTRKCMFSKLISQGLMDPNSRLYDRRHTTDRRLSDMAILVLTIVWKFQKMGPKISEMTEKKFSDIFVLPFYRNFLTFLPVTSPLSLCYQITDFYRRIYLQHAVLDTCLKRVCQSESTSFPYATLFGPFLVLFCLS